MGTKILENPVAYIFMAEEQPEDGNSVPPPPQKKKINSISNIYGALSQKGTLLISFAFGGDLLLWWFSVLDAEQGW